MGVERPSPEALGAYYGEDEMSLAELTADDVRTFRKSIGLSQVAFAAALGTSRRNVEAWEAGVNKPPVFLRWAFAAINSQLEPWEKTELVRVWQFKRYDPQSDENVLSRQMATYAAIIAAKGEPIGEGIEVPASSVDGNGFTQILA